VKEVLFTCFDIADCELCTNKIHDNSYDKIKFEDLPENLQKRFNERTFWDQNLYKIFISN
jgi:hypothetical protein